MEARIICVHVSGDQEQLRRALEEVLGLLEAGGEVSPETRADPPAAELKKKRPAAGLRLVYGLCGGRRIRFRSDVGRRAEVAGGEGEPAQAGLGVSGPKPRPAPAGGNLSRSERHTSGDRPALGSPVPQRGGCADDPGDEQRPLCARPRPADVELDPERRRCDELFHEHRSAIMTLVAHQARQMAAQTPEVEAEELYTVGLAAAHAGLARFEPERRVRVATFLAQRTRGAMIDHLRRLDWVPRLARTQAKRLAAALETCRIRFGRPPTDDELAAVLECTEAELERLRQAARVVGVISLEKKWFETDGFKDVREVELLRDRRGEDPLRPQIDLDVLRRVCRGLSKQERLLVIGYYFEHDNMRQIGRQLGLSESRVSQMHAELIARLQRRWGDRPEEFLCA